MSNRLLRTIPGTCPRCGAPNHDNLRICAYCGTVLVEDVVPTVQPQVLDTLVEMPTVSAPKEPEANPIPVKESQPAVQKKKPSGFAAFLRWTALWAAFCVAVVIFSPNVPNRSADFQIIFGFGVSAHLLIKVIPWLTIKVLILLINLLLLTMVLTNYYPFINPWLVLAVAASAFIVRCRQLIREVKQRG